MEQLCKVATCSLDQWAMDFDTNLRNIVESIRLAKEAGARFRSGPELEVSGYGCEDHFYEQDTFMHSWQSVASILESDLTDGMICDIGMPVMHNSVRYNCRVLLLNRKVLFVRPKMNLADDGNYREGRWFSAWTKLYEVEEHQLPRTIRKITGQSTVPFGCCILACNDTSIACETCEELFTPNSPHIMLGLNGAEIIANGSGSHHSLRKLDTRIDLIRGATVKGGGVYLYANQQGCDGNRLYYDGCCMICMNGEILAQGSQFSVRDVEVISAVLDLEDVRSYRAAVSSRGVQATTIRSFPRVRVDFDMVLSRETSYGQSAGAMAISRPIAPQLLSVEEEIAYGPACWLWDYLRRSGASGFFLPLSGGADSSSVATLVGIMCQLVIREAEVGNRQVIEDVRRLARMKDPSAALPSAKELCSLIFSTCYMGTENSSAETRSRAKRLADAVGSYHMDVDIDNICSAFVNLFATLTGKRPRFRLNGGSVAENLALQNIQARVRMVFSYLLAQLLPWVRGTMGFLLVLGSANVDEALRGYMTKYDCSSADINPIGGISKGDLKRFLLWAAEHRGFPMLREIVAAPPTAELEPISHDYRQSDEADMGMTYEELGIFGRLRKIFRSGPVSMYEKLRHIWKESRPELSPSAIAEKVKRFFYYYSVNRHKLTTLTPAYHAESYSPDDNRFDHRQFLYNTRWTRQFEMVDRLAQSEIGEAGAGESSLTKRNRL